jgi:hypothetical protein
MNDVALTKLVGRIGNLYTRKGLSPPFALRDPVKRWLGLTPDEIIATIEKHFQDCRRFYTSGSGDAHFHMVHLAIRKAWEAKHPSRAHVDDEPERPPRSRSGGVREVYAAGGYADVIDDQDDGTIETATP